MNLDLQNPLQAKIADLLWVADSQVAVDAILKAFGHDAHVVHDMMIAATYDDIGENDVLEADEAIRRIMKEFDDGQNVRRTV